MAIVDNSANAFMFQLDNGIPIVNYYSGDDDDELVHLTNYFVKLSESGDVRTVNAEAF